MHIGGVKHGQVWEPRRNADASGDEAARERPVAYHRVPGRSEPPALTKELQSERSEPHPGAWVSDAGCPEPQLRRKFVGMCEGEDTAPTAGGSPRAAVWDTLASSGASTSTWVPAACKGAGKTEDEATRHIVGVPRESSS